MSRVEKGSSMVTNDHDAHINRNRMIFTAINQKNSVPRRTKFHAHKANLLGDPVACLLGQFGRLSAMCVACPDKEVGDTS